MRHSFLALCASLVFASAAAGGEGAGPYAGLVVGYGFGNSANAWSRPAVDPWTPDGDIAFPGPLGGVLAGYRWRHEALMVGAEADLALARLTGNDSQAAGRINEIVLGGLGTLRLRGGFEIGGALVYGTAGLAAAAFQKRDVESAAATAQLATGWVAGAGVEVALDGDWQLRAEYLHVGLGTVTTPLLFDGSVGYLHRSDAPTLDILRLALTRGF